MADCDDRPRARRTHVIRSMAAAVIAAGMAGAAAPETVESADAGGAAARTDLLLVRSWKTGRAIASPAFHGERVHAIVADRRGGWFVGGEFNRVGSLRCRNLVHVRRGFAVDRSWCPRPDGPVYSLALRGGRLFVGGSFDAIAGARRDDLAAIDARTAAVHAWRPARGTWRSANDLKVAGRVLLFVGVVERAYAARRRIAALDAESGAVLSWAPYTDEDPRWGDSVAGVAVTRRLAYIWGGFTRVGRTRRRELASVSLMDGRVTAWNPQLNGWVSAAAAARGVVFIAGTFTRIAGAPRPGLAAFDAASGRLLMWRPELRGAGVAEIAVEGSTMLVARRRSVVALDATTGRRLSRAAIPLSKGAYEVAIAGNAAVIATGE